MKPSEKFFENIKVFRNVKISRDEFISSITKKTGTTPAKLNTDLIFALSLLTDKQLEDVKRFWKILDSSGRETAWRMCVGIEAPEL